MKQLLREVIIIIILLNEMKNCMKVVHVIGMVGGPFYFGLVQVLTYV